jgi:hypothetical protein
MGVWQKCAKPLMGKEHESLIMYSPSLEASAFKLKRRLTKNVATHSSTVRGPKYKATGTFADLNVTSQSSRPRSRCELPRGNVRY